MNISMHTSNNAGLNPMGFGMQQRYLGMSTGGINVNPRTNQNSLMRTQGNEGMKINRTTQSASTQSASTQSTFAAVNDKAKPADLVANSAPIEEFLDIHTLTIKYKKGDEIVPRLKKNLKAAKLHKKVKFRSDKKLKWSPQYHLDGEVTDLRGYMNTELLYINLIEQLDAWRESSESSGFDDKTDSEAEDSEVEEVVANEDNSGDEEVVANEDNSGDEEVVANEDNSGDEEDQSDDE